MGMCAAIFNPTAINRTPLSLNSHQESLLDVEIHYFLERPRNGFVPLHREWTKHRLLQGGQQS